MVCIVLVNTTYAMGVNSPSYKRCDEIINIFLSIIDQYFARKYDLVN
jgi:hypothetical protein